MDVHLRQVREVSPGIFELGETKTIDRGDFVVSYLSFSRKVVVRFDHNRTLKLNAYSSDSGQTWWIFGK